jgi:hypothetical protein
MATVYAMPEWIPASVRNPDQFVEVTDKREGQSVVRLRRRRDEATLGIDWVSYTRHDAVEPIEPSTLGTFSSKTLDGKALGTFYGRGYSDYSAWCRVRTPREQVTVGYMRPHENDERHAEDPKHPFVNDKAFLENVTRQTLAGYAARRVQLDDHPVARNGQFLATYKSDKGLVYVDLQDMGEKLGFKIKINEAGTEAICAVGGKKFSIVLGANSVLVNGNKKALTDIVMFKDDHFLVPVSVFGK